MSVSRRRGGLCRLAQSKGRGRSFAAGWQGHEPRGPSDESRDEGRSVRRARPVARRRLLVPWGEFAGRARGHCGGARHDCGPRRAATCVGHSVRVTRAGSISRASGRREVAWIEGCSAGRCGCRRPDGRAMARAADASARNPSGRSAVKPREHLPVRRLRRVCRVVVPVAEHGELALYGFS
jgi:hypothetical protein